MSSGVRFAPSPTGTLHLGNLRTAWVSNHLARKLGEPWIVRFEDIDIPRVVHGSQEAQLADLRTLGLVADQIAVQSESQQRHWNAFRDARKDGAIYACTCSRREVQLALTQMASAPQGTEASSSSAIYNGHCRNLKDGATSADSQTPIAWRFKMPNATGSDDFIIARSPLRSAQNATENEVPSSFSPSYHWACAIDDFDGNYRLIVRAIDLEPALIPQRAIQRWLGRDANRRIAYPAVFHTSLVTRNDGGRLEKRTQGVTLSEILEMKISIETLVARFAKSFSEPALDFEAGAILGESKPSMRVDEFLS